MHSPGEDVEDTAEPEEKLDLHQTVNGVEIIVQWDYERNIYVIYFPGLQVGSPKAHQHKIDDQIKLVGKDADEARRIFDQAVEDARNFDDVYTIYASI